MADSNECPICCEDIAKKNVMTCPFCDFICCRECLKEFFLSSSIEFRCMNTNGFGNIKACGRLWTVKHAWSLLGKWLVDPFVKDARRELLLQRELNKKQEYMPYVIREKEREELSAEREECIKILNINVSAEREKERVIFSKRYREERDIKKKKEVRQMLDSVDEKWGKSWDEKITKIRARYAEIEHRFQELGVQGFADGVLKLDKVDLLCHCSAKDCKGMISSFDFKCKLCKTEVCKDCWEVISEKDHQCDKDILENVKNIKKDTKPCPTCRVRAHKIEGCNHFFCPHCKTSWDWASGQVISESQTTNPHYIEWRKKNPIHTPSDPSTNDNSLCSYDMVWNDYSFRSRLDGGVIRLLHPVIEKIDSVILHMRQQINPDQYKIFATKYYLGKWTKRQYEVALLSHYDACEKGNEVIGMLGTWSEVAKELIIDIYNVYKATGGVIEKLRITNAIQILTDIADKIYANYLTANNYWRYFGSQYCIQYSVKYNTFSVQLL